MHSQYKRKRVLHVIATPFEEQGIIGGAERYAFELARHMAEDVPTTLLTFGDKPREEKIGSLQLRIIKPAFYLKGERLSPFSPLLAQEALRADIIHCHQYRVLNSTLTALLGRVTGKRVYVSDLGGGGWDISYRISTARLYRGHLHISRYSRSVAGHANKYWAHVIMGGVDTEKFSPGDSSRDNTVRYVGRILPHKGVDDLVNALPEDMQLEIIGKPYHADFMSYLQEISKGKKVSFRHNCSDAELIESYRKALCVVLPSVYKSSWGNNETSIPELLGQTLLEGMSCGTPAICTDVASMPEIVDDSVTGFVVPPNSPAILNERLNWLRNHPTETLEMGRAARQRVLDHFTWSGVVKSCLNAYGMKGSV